MRRRTAGILAALLGILTMAFAGAEIDVEEAAYTGLIGSNMRVHARGRQDSGMIGRVLKDTRVDVYQKGRSWTRIAYEGGAGYVNTKYVELVQRKDPYDGPMPGVSSHVALARAAQTFTFRPEGYRYPITVREGALLSIEQVRDGKAWFPYRREEERVGVSLTQLELQDFVPWQKAKPGDLLYAFTTFYSTSTQKEGNTGRMYNIALASDRLTHLIVPAGESFSFNAVCAPYTKENGYRAAPILDGESSMGYGGGVCQVCSTIYNIVLRLPTVVEDMNWHSQGGVSYLPAGFDATVSNTKDMVFRNILPYAVRLEFESLDGVMTALLYRADEPANSHGPEQRSALSGTRQDVSRASSLI